MNTTTRLMVSSPRGVLTHLSEHGELTLCGRQVPATWSAEPVTAERIPTCRACAVWAGANDRQARANEAMVERYGADWEQREALAQEEQAPAEKLGAVVRENGLSAAYPASVMAEKQERELAHAEALAEDALRTAARVQSIRTDMMLAAATVPSARCATDDSRGRRAAHRLQAANATERMADAVRNLPGPGSPALC